MAGSHIDFWVAAATVGPVIALAMAVSIGRYFGWEGDVRGQLRAELATTDRRLIDIESALRAVDIKPAQARVASRTERETLARKRDGLQNLARLVASLTVLVALTWVALAWGLVTSLLSLAYSRDEAPPALIAWILFGALVATGGQSAMEYLAKNLALRLGLSFPS